MLPGRMYFVSVGIVHLVIVSLILLFGSKVLASRVDYSYCKPYTTSNDNLGRPFIFIGETYSKRYYLSKDYTTDFFDAAFSYCARFGLGIAVVKTACEYGIVEKWFLSQISTDYTVWVDGFRFGDSTQPPPLWSTTGEPLDFSQFNMDVSYTPGPYPPGGYSPIVYPQVNCLSVTRNCPLYGSGHQNPCKQTPTYPEIYFIWANCRNKLRIMCEETRYSKEGAMNEIE